MNRTWWRPLASGLLAATLSVGIAACDDDTSSGTGDMGAGADMSASVDMTMTQGTPGTGQLVLADLVGTVFSPALPNGAAPRTHTLLALPSLPAVAGTSDPSSDLNLGGLSGCTINRYNTTNLPNPDGDAGMVTFSGWNTLTTIGVDAKTGSKSALASLSPITCTRDATTKTYGCVYGGTFNADGGAMGAPTNDVIYPVIPYRIVLDADKSPAGVNLDCNYMPAAQSCWPAAFGDAACVPRYVPNQAMAGTDIELCEQSPILPLGQAKITESLSGGTDYMAYSVTLGNGDGLDGGTDQFPGPLYIVKVTSGSTDITAFGPDTLTGGNGLSFADGKIDPAQPLDIVFSCDPNNLTMGAGCSTTTLAALLLQTSTAKRDAPAPPLPAGVGQCIQKPTMGHIGVSAAQMTALFGGQTGGSIKIALANLKITLTSNNGHTLVPTAGMGTFGFTNQ